MFGEESHTLDGNSCVVDSWVDVEFPASRTVGREFANRPFEAQFQKDIYCPKRDVGKGLGLDYEKTQVAMTRYELFMYF